MICFRLCGLTVAVDFTAPALLAFLALALPQQAFLAMLSACVLHESAHFLAMLCTRQQPELLRVSAAGLRLTMRRDALCPDHRLCVILLSGCAANLLAAAVFFCLQRPAAAAANLAPALFNLLPYRSTDGGTLLYAGLSRRLLTERPAAILPLMHAVCIVTTLALAILLAAGGVRNPSLWGMLAFMTLSEWSEEN